MVLHTRVLGPGLRTAIWFQGCHRRCKGCMSPASRDLDGGREFSVQEICSRIKKLKDIEGVTVSGGEPFLQIDALHLLLGNLRRTTKLGIIIYTGYTLKQLQEMQDNKVDEIITGLADLIIDGEYVEELNDGGSLRGSSNQQLQFITSRYKSFESLYQGTKRDVEILASGQELFFIGIPNKITLQQWEKTAEQFAMKKQESQAEKNALTQDNRF